MAAAIGPLAAVSVQDIDATRLHHHRGHRRHRLHASASPATIRRRPPLETVQANVPIGANQVDVITLVGPVGTIGEVFSVTITDPPAHARAGHHQLSHHRR